MIQRLIEHVEGEALLRLEKDADGRIKRADILFPHIRGMEKILQRRDALDALAFTPRVCGICGHAHLMATVAALESCYAQAGVSLEISAKARTLRRFTLAMEMVQNHLKWFYLTLLPVVMGPAYNRDVSVLSAHTAASACGRAVAVMGGQWPHTSYALPGGVMCDPSHVERLQALAAVEEAGALFQKRMGLSVDAMAELEDPALLWRTEGDLALLLRRLEALELLEAGQSFDRFLVLADHTAGPAGKSLKTRLAAVETAYVEEDEPLQSAGYANFAKPVRYRGRFYEVGPLARAMVAKDPLVRRLHRRYRDAVSTRIIARVKEAAVLLCRSAQMLRQIDLGDPSYIKPRYALRELGSLKGEGAVEAARGSLLHRVHLRNGRIARYCIITPTQWNLASATDEPGVAATAMVGLKDEKAAEVVFKAFDVCSVCTTQ